MNKLLPCLCGVLPTINMDLKSHMYTIKCRKGTCAGYVCVWDQNKTKSFMELEEEARLLWNEKEGVE